MADGSNNTGLSPGRAGIASRLRRFVSRGWRPCVWRFVPRVTVARLPAFKAPFPRKFFPKPNLRHPVIVGRPQRAASRAVSRAPPGLWSVLFGRLPAGPQQAASRAPPGLWSDLFGRLPASFPRENNVTFTRKK